MLFGSQDKQPVTAGEAVHTMSREEDFPHPGDPCALAQINRVQQISDRSYCYGESIFSIPNCGLVVHVSFVNRDRRVGTLTGAAETWLDRAWA